MLAPSKATFLGLSATLKVARVAPSLVRSLVTVLSELLATQTLAPSKAMPDGEAVGEPTVKIPRIAPSLARTFVTERAPFVTHRLVPSKAILTRRRLVFIRLSPLIHVSL